MSKRVANWLPAALACIFSLQPCAAQTDDWERVKVIQPGRQVQIKLHSAKTIKGRMDAWRADGLSVKQGKSVTSFDKADVAEVVLLIGRSRGRKALLAGTITGGAVAGLVGAAYASGGDCCSDGPAEAVVPLAAGVWGGIAAGIAALFPQHKEVIYSTARPDTGRKPAR